MYRLEDVYDRFAPSVLGYFRGRGAQDPEALCGDVFVSVAGGLRRFRGDDVALRRWIFTIAHNRLVDGYRAAARHQEHSVAEPPEHVAVDAPDERLDSDLVAALSRLTAEQRDVLLLRFVSDLPISDVARVVGKKSGAVKMLQARGLEELRRELGDRRDQPTAGPT